MKGILNSQSMIYQQIAEFIEEGIINSEYVANEQVPSTNEIAKAFNINPATAAKGVNRLVDEGLLYKKRGIGMFVEENAQELLLKSRRETFASEDAKNFLTKAKKLKFSKEDILKLINESKFEEE